MEKFYGESFSMSFWSYFSKLFLRLTEAHSEPFQTSRMERFAKIING